MSDFAAPTPLGLALPPRRVAIAAALALAVATAALGFRLAPGPLPGMALGLFCGGAALTLAALEDAKALALWAKLFGGLAALLALLAAAPIPPDRLYLPFALGSLGLFGFGLRQAATPWSLGLSPRASFIVVAGLVVALAAFNIWYVMASRDLMIADFMYYRLVSIAVATLVRAGKLAPLLIDFLNSMKQDYSWAPALAPGLALAAFGPLSRAVYQGAIVIVYAAPALLALAWAAREIAGDRRTTGAFVLASIAVVAAYPLNVVIASRGMPDIGGLALYVLALSLADKLARALRAAPERARGLAFALALTLFAMFLFRRWYAFAAVGVIVALGLEVAAVAWKRGRAFAWREAALAASVALLTLVGLLAPVLVDWMRDPAAHDYARMYAAYRKSLPVLTEFIGDNCGFALLALALLSGVALSWRSRLARMTLAAALVSAALFLRVQSPYPHHLYLLAPTVCLFVAAPLVALFQRSRAAGAASLAALAVATLTPAGALAPRGLLPTVGWPHAPRADLAELARMKDWVDARARPDRKVCGLGSSYTFSGQLIDELWQLKADKSPLHASHEAVSVVMSDVDTVDGAPKTAIKDCAYLIVGDPVQTHVIPSYQLTVALPSREMLDGVGIGANYRRTGEVFALEHGVRAVVFERINPLTEEDMAALQARWRKARGDCLSHQSPSC